MNIILKLTILKLISVKMIVASGIADEMEMFQEIQFLLRENIRSGHRNYKQF